jgi:molybdopterin-guanine dinucleotide biosynthesis protein A
MIYSDITGIILAGGKSTRMGENKSLLSLNGKTVIERVVDLMKSIFKEVILITNTPVVYDFIKIPKYKDIFEYKGPLAGIHSGLTHSNTKKSFVISCDILLMDKKMIEFIINYKTNKQITVCWADGFIQQLVGLYSKSVLPIINNLLVNENQNSSVLSLLDKVVPEIINAEELDIYKEYMFFNMNKPEDYNKIKKLVS